MRSFTRGLRRALYVAVPAGLLYAVVSRAIPLDIFQRAISLMASAVWGS